MKHSVDPQESAMLEIRSAFIPAYSENRKVVRTMTDEKFLETRENEEVTKW